MKLKAAIWPELRRIGDFEIQKSLGGDPAVLNYVGSRFIASDYPDEAELAPILVEATEEQWLECSRRWAAEERKIHETSLKYH